MLVGNSVGLGAATVAVGVGATIVGVAVGSAAVGKGEDVAVMLASETRTDSVEADVEVEIGAAVFSLAVSGVVVMHPRKSIRMRMTIRTSVTIPLNKS